MNIKGVDINLLPAKDIYHFGLMLLDLYFTNDELSKSLVMPSTRSNQPVLDQKKVSTIFSKYIRIKKITKVRYVPTMADLMKQRFPKENLGANQNVEMPITM